MPLIVDDRVIGVMEVLDKISAPSWWLYSRVLRRSYINKVALKIFDKTVWLWRRIDGVLPWRGLSLILVSRK